MRKLYVFLFAVGFGLFCFVGNLAAEKPAVAIFDDASIGGHFADAAQLKAITSLYESEGYCVDVLSADEICKPIKSYQCIFWNYPNCIPDQAIEPVKNYLRNGGGLICLQDVPLMYTFVKQNGKWVRGGRAPGSLLGLNYGVLDKFAGKSAVMSAAGKKEFPSIGKHSRHGFIRTFSFQTADRGVIVPYLLHGDSPVLFLADYNEGGRVLVGGYSGSFANSPFSPNSETGREFLLSAAKILSKPMFRVFDVFGDKREIASGESFIVKGDWKGQLPDKPFKLIAEFFSADSKRVAVVSKVCDPSKCVNGFELEVPAGELIKTGFYTLKARVDDGPSAKWAFTVCPKVSIEYIDAQKVFWDKGEKPVLSIAVFNRSNAQQKVTVICEPVDDLGKRSTLVKPTVLLPALATAAVNIEANVIGDADSYYRVSLISENGQVCDELVKRLEVAKPRPLLSRSPRSYLSTGPESAGDPLWKDMEMRTKKFPHFKGLNMMQVQLGDAASRFGDDFVTMSNAHLGSMGSILNILSRGPGGTNPVDIPGCCHPHAESRGLWGTYQAWRSKVDQVFKSGADQFALCEAVTGYGPPSGDFGGLLGYAGEDIDAYRRDLLGCDGGFRMLVDENNYKRLHFADLYKWWMDKELPTAQSVGFDSWSEYDPIKVNSRMIGGFLRSEKEKTLVSLHWFLCAYENLKMIDSICEYSHSKGMETYILPNHDGSLNGQIQHLFWRLPYADGIYVELFLSIYNQLPYPFHDIYWEQMAKRYKKRVILCQEIGHGGNGVPYRVADDTQMAVYAFMNGDFISDLQVDFSHPENQSDHGKNRMTEELAAFAGFEAAMADEPKLPERKLLVVDVNRAYFPIVYQRFYRFDLTRGGDSLLTYRKTLTNAGFEFDTCELPLFDASQLEKYEVIVFNAPRHMEGDMGILSDWIRAQTGKPRTLILNSVMAGQMDYSGGATPAKAIVTKPDVFQIFDLPKVVSAEHKLINKLNAHKQSPFADLDNVELKEPIGLLYPTELTGGRALLSGGHGEPLVWEKCFGQNRLVIIGLPFDLTDATPMIDTLATRIVNQLITPSVTPSLFYTPTSNVVVTKYYNNKNSIDLIIAENRSEIPRLRKRAGSEAYKPYWMDKIAKSLDPVKVDITLPGLSAGKNYNLVDQISAKKIANIKANEQGVLTFSVDVVFGRWVRIESAAQE